jgi:hypothetical protein
MELQGLSAISAGIISMSLRDTTSARMQELIVILTAAQAATKELTLMQESLATRVRSCSLATSSDKGTKASLPSATSVEAELMT